MRHVTQDSTGELAGRTANGQYLATTFDVRF